MSKENNLTRSQKYQTLANNLEKENYSYLELENNKPNEELEGIIYSCTSPLGKSTDANNVSASFAKYRKSLGSVVNELPSLKKFIEKENIESSEINNYAHITEDINYDFSKEKEKLPFEQKELKMIDNMNASNKHINQLIDDINHTEVLSEQILLKKTIIKLNEILSHLQSTKHDLTKQYTVNDILVVKNKYRNIILSTETFISKNNSIPVELINEYKALKKDIEVALNKHINQKKIDLSNKKTLRALLGIASAGIIIALVVVFAIKLIK